MWLIALIMLPCILLADIKLFKFFYENIFRDERDFKKSLKYSITPDIFSLFRGEYFKDNFAEFKLGIFMTLCMVTIILEVSIVRSIL